MRTMKFFAAGAAALTLMGAGAASASALSLGPAGTNVSATGYIGGSIPGLAFGYTGAGTTSIQCTSTKETGTLDGGPSVTLAVTFSSCRAAGKLAGAATVSAPGGMELSAKSTSYGQLTTGSGLVFKVGTCTLRVPGGLSLVTPQGNPNRLTLRNGSGGTTAQLTFDNLAQNLQLPYTGSAACPAPFAGSHTVGFGDQHFFLGTFAGMNVS